MILSVSFLKIIALLQSDTTNMNRLDLEKAMAPHSSTLAWKIPWMEEPGGLQSMGSLRVRDVWATSFSLFTFMHWRKKLQPTPVFLPGESKGRGAWWAAVYGVTQSQTRLKWLSSSSSRFGYSVVTGTSKLICLLWALEHWLWLLFGSHRFKVFPQTIS